MLVAFRFDRTAQAVFSTFYSGLGGLRRGNFDGREADQEARSRGNVVFDAKSAVMFRNDAAGDGKA